MLNKYNCLAFLLYILNLENHYYKVKSVFIFDVLMKKTINTTFIFNLGKLCF
jgi:hypothetical protein